MVGLRHLKLLLDLFLPFPECAVELVDLGDIGSRFFLGFLHFVFVKHEYISFTE